tara:strand:+ start:2023 stop:3339 length:1317 start_codon:yes stop_codon:yes gene_type:complete
MTNKTINGLTGATTPLAGTEEVPIWDGASKKVTVANLTAGRAISALTVSASGAITTTGATGSASANKASLSYDGAGNGVFLQSYGPDAATNGVMYLRTLRSDGSNAVNALAITGAGAVTTGGPLTVTGAVNGLTVGLGGGSVATNTAVGTSALAANTTGPRHVAVGYQALFTNTNSADVTAIGYRAGYTMNGANGGTFVGSDAGQLATGAYNTCFGVRTGKVISSGTGNTFVGASTATGDGAGAAVTTGSNNVILGGYAGTAALSGNIILSDGSGNIKAQYDGTLWTLTDAVKHTTGISVGGATPGAGGIAFPATAVAVADPNTLDDYEEGTWTPTLNGWTNVGTPTVTATYTKIGRLVFFTIEIAPATSIATTVVTSTVTNLPFAVGKNVAVLLADASNAAVVYSPALMNTAAGGTIYVPTIGPTADYLEICGTYFV